LLHPTISSSQLCGLVYRPTFFKRRFAKMAY
jgi:hypothetical protein